MKNLAIILALSAFFSCSKKDALEAKATGNYQIRIAAVEMSGARSYTPVSRVKPGKVAVEFETAEVADVKEYDVEVSADGINFRRVKTIAADQKTPDKFYRDTVVAE